MMLKKYIDFWDDYIQKYHDKHGMTVMTPSRLVGQQAKNSILTLLKNTDLDFLKKQVIMDYGCGTGRLSKLLAPLCKRVICVDISEKMLDKAKLYLKDCNNIDYILYRDTPLPFAKNEIFLTISYAALIYMPESDFWKTLKMIDDVSQTFCLNLNHLFNEAPQCDQVLNPGQDFYSVHGYRPTPETLLSHYSEKHYFIERHEPELRGNELFFYKSTLKKELSQDFIATPPPIIQERNRFFSKKKAVALSKTFAKSCAFVFSVPRASASKIFINKKRKLKKYLD